MIFKKATRITTKYEKRIMDRIQKNVFSKDYRLPHSNFHTIINKHGTFASTDYIIYHGRL